MDEPIPLICADRPVVGGRVVPHVSVVLATGRPVLGAVHRTKAMRCITDFRCQVCGNPLTRPIIVLASAANVAQKYSGEAALHPQCARYSMAACPAMAGHVTSYRQVDGHEGSACSEPGCRCAGWVDADPSRAATRGNPIGPWFAVWLPSYDIAVNDKHEVHGLTWLRHEPLRVRPVPGTHAMGDGNVIES